MPFLLKYVKFLTPRNIAIFVGVLFLVYAYFTDDIVSKSEIRKTEKTILDLQADVNSRDNQIHNYKVKNKKLQSDVDACRFGQEMEEFLKELGGSEYEAVDINITSSHLPF